MNDIHFTRLAPDGNLPPDFAPAAPTAALPCLTCGQIIEVASFLYDAIYTITRERLGGRGYVDMVQPDEAGRERGAPTLLLSDTAYPLSIAQWATSGVPNGCPQDTFGRPDEPLTRAFLTIARALEAGTLWRGWPRMTARSSDGTRYVAHAPQPEPCPVHGPATVEAAQSAAYVCATHGVEVVACLACALEQVEVAA